MAEGFGSYVDDQMHQAYGDKWLNKSKADQDWGGRKGGQKPSLADPDFVLWAARYEWQSVFRKVLGQAERGWVGELRDARGK